MSIQVLSCDLKLKKPFDNVDNFHRLNYLKLTPNESSIDCIKYEYIDKQRLVDELVNLSKRCKKVTGSSITGRVVFFDKDSAKTGVLKLTSKECKEIMCSIKITPLLKDKKDKTQLSTDDKIELLHGFYKENKRTPLTGEEYHSFKVGNVYKNVMKQKQIVKAVENVVK